MANGIELATAYVSLAVDGSQVDKGVRKSLSGVDAQADKVGQTAGKKMGGGISSGILGAVGKLAGPIAAVFAGIKVGQFLGDSIAEAVEAQKVGAATDAIIKATGGVAKISAQNVADLSQALSEKVGIDDELIQSGANVLLTFKKVRNEIGQGNDVFDRATKAAVDLSATPLFNGNITGATKQLGKALQDPVKGVAALTKAGVQFSDVQKEQIRNFVETGDLLGAQKIILDEVESQVGGVAEATATTGEKVRVSWDNVKEQIGTALLPMLERLGRWFLEEGLPAIKEFGGWVRDELWPALKDGWETVRPALEQAQALLAGVFGDESTGDMRSFSDFLTQTLIPGIATFASVALPAMAAAWAGVGRAAEAAGAIFSLQATIVRTIANVIINAFVAVTTTAADMLDVLSVVPGFGWAKDAARELRGVADKAREVKDAINGLPTSKTFTMHFTSTGQLRLPNGVNVDMGVWRARAHGGPVRKGEPYVVGEKRPELFIPTQNGRIVPRVPDATAPAAMGGFDYLRMGAAVAEAVEGVRPVVDTKDNARAVAMYTSRRARR